MKIRFKAIGSADEKNKIRYNPKITMIIALVAIWTFFAFTTEGAFFTPRNFSNLFRQMSVTGLLAVGMVFVIVSGEIDLSVGSFIGLVGGVAAILTSRMHVPDVLVIVLTLVLAVLMGLWNGFWVAYRRVPAFIVTLAGMLVFRGILIGITNGQTISGLTETMRFIGQGYIGEVIGYVLGAIAIVYAVFAILNSRITKKKYGLDVKPLWQDVLKIVGSSILIALFIVVMNSYTSKEGVPFGIPFPVLILLVAAVVLTYLANKTVFGRRVYAMGGNIEATRLSGVNVKALKLLVFALNGLLAGFAGIVLMSRLNAASVAAGQNEELNAIAACVIGGTSMLGGIGTISGAIIGGLVMASIDTGITMLNTPPFWQYVVKGMVLLAAVWIDVASKNKE